jgi:hypothetical protein
MDTRPFEAELERLCQLMNANIRARNAELSRQRAQAGGQHAPRPAADHSQPQPQRALSEQWPGGNPGRGSAQQPGAGDVHAGWQQDSTAPPQAAMHAEARAGSDETLAVPELDMSDWQWFGSVLGSGEPAPQAQQGMEASLLQRVAGPDAAGPSHNPPQPPWLAAASRVAQGKARQGRMQQGPGASERALSEGRGVMAAMGQEVEADAARPSRYSPQPAWLRDASRQQDRARQHRMQQGPGVAERALSEGRGMRPAWGQQAEQARRRRIMHSREMERLGLNNASLDGRYWTQLSTLPKQPE